MNIRPTMSRAKRVAVRAAVCAAVLGFGAVDVADPAYVEQDKVVPAGTDSGDCFGLSVSVDGMIAVVGAQFGDMAAAAAGAAYILLNDGAGNWSQSSGLFSDDAESGDQFGASVAISGDTAVVGAYGKDESGASSGAAYVFRDDGTGNWKQVDKLTPGDGDAGDYFGFSVGISGDSVIVGAFSDDDCGDGSGSAYVLQDDGTGEWTEAAKLTADDAAASDEFGRSVSISGDTVVVGAWGADDNGSDSGAAYVFQTDGAGGWTQVDMLLAGDSAAGDYFGSSVSIWGDSVIVGAFGDDDMGSDSGSAYIFQDDGTGSWLEIDKLLADDGAAGDQFGASVSICDGSAVIGSFADDQMAVDAGAAYVFEEGGAGWEQIDKLVGGDGELGDYFGASVSIGGGSAIIGACGDDDNGAASGSAYVFVQSPTAVPLPAAAWMGILTLGGIAGAGAVRRGLRSR